jgi:hypothetical protein
VPAWETFRFAIPSSRRAEPSAIAETPARGSGQAAFRSSHGRATGTWHAPCSLSGLFEDDERRFVIDLYASRPSRPARAVSRRSSSRMDGRAPSALPSTPPRAPASRCPSPVGTSWRRPSGPAQIFYRGPAQVPVPVVDFVEDETGLQHEGVRNHGMVRRFGVHPDVEILLITRRRPSGTASARRRRRGNRSSP